MAVSVMPEAVSEAGAPKLQFSFFIDFFWKFLI
jgi:hypothetical protein